MNMIIGRMKENKKTDLTYYLDWSTTPERVSLRKTENSHLNLKLTANAVNQA